MLEGRYRSASEAFDAFGHHLEACDGRGLNAIAPMEDVSRLWQELARKDDYSVWLQSFFAREDVRVAANTFAAGVRQSGESGRLMAAWANRQEPEDIP